MTVRYIEVPGGSHDGVVAPNLAAIFEFLSAHRKSAPRPTPSPIAAARPPYAARRVARWRRVYLRWGLTFSTPRQDYPSFTGSSRRRSRHGSITHERHDRNVWSTSSSLASCRVASWWRHCRRWSRVPPPPPQPRRQPAPTVSLWRRDVRSTTHRWRSATLRRPPRSTARSSARRWSVGRATAASTSGSATDSSACTSCASPGRVSHICVGVDNFDADRLAAKCKDMGIGARVDRNAANRTSGGDQLYIDAFDGHRLQLAAHGYQG